MNKYSLKGPTVLIAACEADLHEQTAATLTGDGFNVVMVASAAAAFEALANSKDIGVVVVDDRLPDTDGLGLIESVGGRLLVATRPRAILIAGSGTLEMVVGAMRLGVFDFLNKPAAHDELVNAVRNAMNAWVMATRSAAPTTSVRVERSASVASDQIRAMLRERHVQTRLFSSQALRGASWAVFLALALADMEGRQLNRAELCVASGTPATMASRAVDRLVHSGLVQKHSEPDDRRQCVVTLTESGRDRLTAYLEYLESKSGSGEGPQDVKPYDGSHQHVFAEGYARMAFG